MTKKKAALHNLGCKVNAYETEAMQELLVKDGYEIVPFEPGADLYIINTCSVTNIADRKSRQMLHRARKMNPDAIVVAAGCYVQSAKDEVEKDPAIDIVIGNNRKKDLIRILNEFEAARKEKMAADGKSRLHGDEAVGQHNRAQFHEDETAGQHGEAQPCKEEAVVQRAGDRSDWVIDISHTKEYEALKVTCPSEHTRAYLKVQDGCNQFCSYCIIPYTRGRVRSRELEDVAREVEGLAAAGFQEIVLTGIHLSSYGMDTGSSLLALIRRLHGIGGIQRIRLGSLEPRIITEEFVHETAAMEKLCPHFHLSLQSGCDATLKRMNRKYTAEEYYEKCVLLRESFDHPALTTDVIVGFPKETEEEFAETKRFLEKVEFYETHIFKYSRRQGTRAAVMEGQVSDQVKTARSEELLALRAVNQAKFEERLAGTVRDVLFEEALELEGAAYMTGYTKEYVRIAVPWRPGLENQIVPVTVTKERKGGILVTMHGVGEVRDGSLRPAPYHAL